MNGAAIAAGSGEPTRHFAPLHLRIRALAIDTGVVALSIVISLIAVDVLSPSAFIGRAAWIAMFTMLLVYEPFLVWRRGATLGHRLARIKVVDVDTVRRPSFRQAATRFLAKVLLGIPSFVAVLLTRRHQALHDLIAGTTVEVSEAGIEQGVPSLPQRESVEGDLPSARRRAVVIIAYETVLLVLVGLAPLLLLSPECLETYVCSAGEGLFETVVSAVWIVLAAAVVMLGWRGVLPGARAVDSKAGVA